MHCFYQDIDPDKSVINLINDEEKHQKVLRLKKGEKILITNGKGLTAECEYLEHSSFKVLKINENMNENKYHLTICLAIIQDRSRLEFAVEKLTEIGVNEIILLKTDFTQKTNINLDRLYKKAISALKQSNRSVLPIISHPVRISELNFKSKSNFYLASKLGESKVEAGDSVCFIGPEAGFSEEEENYIYNKFGSKKIKLSNSILRAETAAISISSKIIGM